MEKPSEYRSILFDINLKRNICLNPWLEKKIIYLKLQKALYLVHHIA